MAMAIIIPISVRIALRLPPGPIQGGIYASTPTQYIVTNRDRYETECPSPYGSTVNSRTQDSPGTDEVGNPDAAGGAALRIEARNYMTIDGEISANGVYSVQTGGGVSGSVKLSAKNLKQSTGSVRANSGASTSSYGGGGESTRVTCTGKSIVGVKMSVKTFSNPLGVRTAHETLLDTLSNFFSIPKSHFAASDLVESGTRVISVTVIMATDVTSQTRRVLLQESSRVEDSLVESCFKCVKL